MFVCFVENLCVMCVGMNGDNICDIDLCFLVVLFYGQCFVVGIGGLVYW